MERRREKVEEKTEEQQQEIYEKEFEELMEEYKRLKAIKIKKEREKQKEEGKPETTIEQNLEELEEKGKIDEIEQKFDEIENLFSQQIEKSDIKTFEKSAEYIKAKINNLEEEILGEKGVVEKELSPFEKLLKDYTWLEEPRYEFMYSIPDQKTNPGDYESWKEEWAKVLYDYAKYSILHIIYLRQLYDKKPFSKFPNRKNAIQEIAEELIEQGLAKWLSKKKEKLRVFWKTLDLWAEEIYEWALEWGKLEPIAIYELREAKQDFSNLPKDDIKEIFLILSREGRGKYIETENGQISLRIKLE
jgi:hypothetical protein